LKSHEDEQDKRCALPNATASHNMILHHEELHFIIPPLQPTAEHAQQLALWRTLFFSCVA